MILQGRDFFCKRSPSHAPLPKKTFGEMLCLILV